MTSKILSIIIPAYNVEPYIERCLDSITNNIKHIDDLDIIVINDGSKDKTLELSLKYEKHYSQSVRVIDKPNGGWGTGINMGIQEAQGKYLKTLDSDDWFNSESLDEFIELLKNIDVDMVLTSLNEVNISGDERKIAMPGRFCEQSLQIDEYLINNNYNLNAPIHAVTYRTSLLKDTGFKVADKYYGDLDYIITPLIHVNTIYISSINLYQYFIGREGQSISVNGYNAHLDDYLLVCYKTIEFWMKNKNILSMPLRQTIKVSVFERIRWAYFLLMSPVYSGNKKDSKEKLLKLDNLLKDDKEMYKMTNKISYKKIVPWIYIWRKTGLNLFKLYNK